MPTWTLEIANFAGIIYFIEEEKLFKSFKFSLSQFWFNLFCCYKLHVTMLRIITHPRHLIITMLKVSNNLFKFYLFLFISLSVVSCKLYVHWFYSLNFIVRFEKEVYKAGVNVVVLVVTLVSFSLKVLWRTLYNCAISGEQSPCLVHLRFVCVSRSLN